MVERVRAARDAGLESLFLGEHHATGGSYYQNVPILGRLLGEWGDRPVAALFLLPLGHPVLLAGEEVTAIRRDIVDDHREVLPSYERLGDVVRSVG